MADVLELTHPASGTRQELAITDSTIRATDLRRLVVGGVPLATYDPG